MDKYIKILLFAATIYLGIANYGERSKNKELVTDNIENRRVDSLAYSNLELAMDGVVTQLEVIREEKCEIRYFWNSIAAVESSSGLYVVGDSGRAFGHFQIWNITVEDVNRIYGTSYTHAQMFDPVIAMEFGMLYLNHGAKLYYKKYYKLPSVEILARMWNGGIYGGHYNAKTLVYLDKFNKEYQRV